MMDLAKILQQVDAMSIRELERHVQERSATVAELHAEKRILTPHLDAKYRKQAEMSRGPAGLSQSIDIHGGVIKLGGM